MRKWFKNTRLYKFLDKHKILKNLIVNTFFTIIICGLVIALQYALGPKGHEGSELIKDENIFLIFTFAVILILIKTKNILYGVVSSIVFVLFFDLLNVPPYYELTMFDENYYISFFIFIIIALIVGTLVLELQRRNKQAMENSKKVHAMYDLSSKLLDKHEPEFIFNFLVDFFHNNMRYKFAIIDEKGEIYGEIEENEDLLKMKNFCLEKNIVVGKGTFSFKNSPYLAFPIRSKENNYGVLFAILGEADMPKEEVEFVSQNILHSVVALDRESAIKAQESAKIDIEREKLKNALLRSLSHDLKTPLTSIKSGSDLILNSYDQIDDATKKEVVSDIYNEACDLNEFIVNLLNMTKLNQDKTLVVKKQEPVDDILSEVKNKIERNLDGKTLEIKHADELVFVYADAIMLEQVLSNLISNAIKHTKPGTKISIEYEKDEEGVNFSVIDNGGGIEDKNLDKIFEDFYTLALKQDHHRGTGLGLSICKTIVEAHGGQIKAYNNDIGGATFKFNIPNK